MIRKTLLLVFVTLITFCGIAQETDSVKIIKDKPERLNEISWVLTDIIDGSYMLRYERSLNQSFSVGFSFGYKGEDGLIKISGIDGEKIKTGGITYSGIKMLTEFRYYIKKTKLDALSGFYVGTYFKMAEYNSDLFGKYFDINDKTYGIDIGADVQILSLGTTVGYKFAFNDRLHLDLIFAGPGFGWHKYEVNSRLDLPDSFYENLSNELNKYSIFELVPADFDFNFRRSKTEFKTVSFRYGISIGFTF